MLKRSPKKILWVELRLLFLILLFHLEKLFWRNHAALSSPNKHNRLYFEARPLEDGLAEAIDDGRFGLKDDPKARAKPRKVLLPKKTCGVFALGFVMWILHL